MAKTGDAFEPRREVCLAVYFLENVLSECGYEDVSRAVGY